MRKRIDNNYEVYSNKAGGTASIIFESSTNTTNSKIELIASGSSKHTFNSATKYVGAVQGSIAFCGSTDTIIEIDIPIYSNLMVKFNFNVFKSTPTYGNQSYSAEKVASFVRGSSGNAAQVGSTTQLFAQTNFSGIDTSAAVNGTKASIRLTTPFTHANVGYQLNYEYVIVTNTDIEEPFINNY